MAIVKAAAVQISPVLYSRAGTVEKVINKIRQLGEQGVQFATFPETVIPYYPYFSFVQAPFVMGKEHLRLLNEAVTVPSAETDAIGAAAREANMVVSIGVNERDGNTLYNTQLLFDSDGTLIQRRRKLTPTYQAGADPENYGCGVLSDGRMLTTDLGGQAPGDPGNGQFIVWFGEPEGTDQTYCKVDVELATAQSLLVGPDDEVYVVSARPPTSGVWRYTDLPTSADAAGGCGSTDVTGAPMADAVTREQVLAPGPNDILSPAGIAFSPNGGYYLSSVITGVINEYDADWQFVRTILAPPEGEAIGADASLSTGTPLGIGVTPDGQVWYADIGIVNDPENGFGPGDGTGHVRRILFVDGEPQPPETVASDLAFPDGIGVYVPGGAAGGGANPA